ncbi:MAG: prevent-host-death protein [Tannerella sp.]|jgi:hypothetical protein|nr:prevent-host-death protein [Tannerella sp.]
MIVVSTREFRDNQKNYLDQLDSGIEILIQRGKKKTYKIIPVTNDDTLINKVEFFAKIDRALKEVAEGKAIEMLPDESLTDFLDRTKGSI